MSALMAKDTKKPAGGGKPKKNQVNVVLPDELLASLDKYIASQEVPPERPAVIRKALEDFLIAKKFHQ